MLPRRPPFLREPLLQFLAAGLLLFVALRWLAPPAADTSDVIRVDAALVEGIASTYELGLGQRPDAQQLDQLVQDHVRDEVLYREALRAGLDRGDEIVRRRLIQKMEQLNSLGTEPEAVDAGALQAFHAANPGLFTTPALVSFRHLYFSPDAKGAPEAVARGDRALQDIVAASLQSTAQLPPALTASADRFPLQPHYSRLSPQNAAQLFGASEFAAALFSAEPGQWTGPLRSGYGWHLLYVTARSEPEQPALQDILPQVEALYREQLQQDNAERALEQQRLRYRIDYAQ